MKKREIEDTDNWAEKQWGEAELGDKRRNKQAIKLGSSLAKRPGASLPNQTGSWKDLKSAYRLLNEEDVTHQALIKPHCQATRLEAENQSGVVLFIQDTSDCDYTHHPETTGLGLIADGTGRGFMMHNCLAIKPDERKLSILGLAGQRLWLRTEIKRGNETRTERMKRWTESELWAEMVEQIGVAPAAGSGTIWVTVGDRASDNFSYWRRAQKLNWEILSRVFQERRIETIGGKETTLKTHARTLPAKTSKQIQLRGRNGKPKRDIQLKISYEQVQILAPRMGSEKQAKPFPAYIVRCWEESESEEAIEWILVTTLKVTEAEQAKQIVNWYGARWIVEEYHKCLKTGCQLESRQLQSGQALMRLLGFLGIVALRLLAIRELARSNPNEPAKEHVSVEIVQIVVNRLGLNTTVGKITMREFWHGVGRLGGFIGRKSDGEPGWQTIWGGWQRIQDMCWGATFNSPA